MCVTLSRKSKRKYQNLSAENVWDNKNFWKAVKPLLSKKIKSSEKITADEGTKILKTDKGTAKVLNNFLSTIIQNLKIPQYKEQDPISASISDPLMKKVVKCRVHISIIGIKKSFNSSTSFNFSYVLSTRYFERDKICKQIREHKILTF